MCNLRTILVFALYSSSLLLGSAWAANAKPNTLVNRNPALTSNISPSDDDSSVARRISFLLDNFQKSGVTKGFVQEVVQSISSKSIFFTYKKTFENVIHVLNETNLKKLAHSCEEALKVSVQDKLPEAVLSLACREQVLRQVANKSVRSKMSNDDKIFFNTVVSSLVHDDQFLMLVKFLESIQSDKSFHKTMSSILDDLFIARRSEIPQNILKKMEISSNLTAHIQDLGLNAKDTQEVFHGELKSLGNNLMDIINSKTYVYEEIQSALDRFINFFNANEQNFPKDKTWKIFNSVGKTLLSKHLYKEGELLFSTALKCASEENSKEALFNLFWVYLMKENYQEAYTFIKKYSILEKFNSMPSNIQFWTAFTLEMNDQKAKALEHYQHVVENFGFDFYSIFSAKRYLELGGNRNSIETQLKGLIKESPIPADISTSDFNEEYLNTLKRVMLWGRYNELDMIGHEVRKILSTQSVQVFSAKSKFHSIPETVKKEMATLMIANCLSANGQYLLSFSIIQNNMGSDRVSFNKNILNSLFPSPYFDQIREFKGEVDPILVLSLIRQESGFNPRARSRVGARGLMQLMPATARQIQRKVAAGQLDHPETNLKIGIQYFKKLFSKYSGNLVFTLAAYNAGERNLQRWATNIFRSESLLHTIESIPYNETRKYVKLIFRNIFFYRFLQTASIEGDNLQKIFDLGLALPTKNNY